MPSGGFSLALVGRQAEIRRLASLADQSAAGRGAAIVVEGEPGIGKSTLLDAAAADYAGRGLRVLRGAGEELAQRLPFATMGTCLGVRERDDDPALARVAKLLHGEGAFGQSIAAANHELAVIEAIVDLMDQWCAAGPLALMVDDIQWADASSALTLHRLGRLMGQQPLLIVVAGRPIPRTDEVAGLLRGLTSHGASVLKLASLDQAESAALAGKLVAAQPGPDLLHLVIAAGGNPMYVTELITALIREDAIRTVDGVAELRGDTPDLLPGRVPRSLAEMISQRLDILPRRVRETLQMAAALGPTVDVTELSTVLETSIPVLSEAVLAAIDADLLIDTGDRVTFRHDLIREVLAGNLPTSVRTALHLRAGQILAATGASVERVAEHLMVGTRVDQQTIDWLISHADQLTVRAPQAAVTLIHRALDSADEPVIPHLRFHLVRALLWVGSAGQAEQAARAALAAGPEPAREGTLRWLLAQACYRQGHLADAQAAAREALTSPHLSQGEIGRFHGFLALCLVVMFQHDDSAVAAREAVAVGTAAGDQVAVGYGHELLAGVRMMQGELTEALAHNGQALDALGGGIQPDLQLDAHYIRGYCLARLDRFVEADEALATSVRENLRSGGIYLALSSLVRARMRFLDGRWDDALAEAQTGIDSFDPYNYAIALRALTALIAVHRRPGSGDSQKVPVDDGSPGARSSRFMLLWAQALVDEVQQGPRAALDQLYPVWRDGGLMEHPSAIYDICPDLARLAVAVGDRERGAQLAESTEALAANLPSPTTNGIALLCRGLADEDAERLLAAAQTFGQAGRALFEGYAYEQGAAMLARTGDGAQAREVLAKALALYNQLDAAWDAGRAESLLRQAGVRRGVKGPRKRPKHGWEALTDTEHKIVKLVAQGRSNPDIAAQMFLSSRTVQTHVSSILAKLSLSSRVELAISAVRRDAPVEHG